LRVESKVFGELMDYCWEGQNSVVWAVLPGVGNQMNGSGLYVPLPAEKKDVGVMEILHSEKNLYNYHDVVLAEMVAGYAGAKIAVNQSNKRVEQYEIESHDLKTPLTVLCGVGDLMGQVVEKYEDADQTLDQLVPLINSVTKCAKRVNTYLKSSSDLRGIAKGEEVKREVYEIGPWITDLFSMYQEKAKQKGIEFCLSNTSNGSKFLVDEGLVTRAAMNLINNAFNHVDEGGRICVISSVMGNKYNLTVSNTGSHIPEHEQPKVFKIGTTIPRGNCQEGQGIGLAVAEAVATGHRGKLTLYSTPEEGTTFNLSLPLR